MLYICDWILAEVLGTDTASQIAIPSDRPRLEVLDRYLMNVDQRVFAIWDSLPLRMRYPKLSLLEVLDTKILYCNLFGG